MLSPFQPFNKIFVLFIIFFFSISSYFFCFFFLCLAFTTVVLDKSLKKFGGSLRSTQHMENGLVRMSKGIILGSSGVYQVAVKRKYEQP